MSKANTYSRLRGTKDLLETECQLWESLEAKSIEVFRAYGYEGIRTPIIELSSLFKRSVGEVTDIVQKEMYQFTDRSGDEISLRPEGTAGVVRAYIENGLGNDGPKKLYYFGPMFRAERPQAGRFRQFHQLGAEYFGQDSPLADVETIQLLTDLLKKLGIQNFKVRINNLGSEEDRIRYAEILKDFLSDKISMMCDECARRYETNVFRLLDCKNPSCRSKVIVNAPAIHEQVSEKSARHFQQVCDLLTSVGVRYDIDPSIIRGLDYYTHTVFEVTSDGIGSQDAIAAGGRYNGLVERLGGKTTSAVGFAAGIERLCLAMKEESRTQMLATKYKQVYLIGLGEAAKAIMYKILSELRASGIQTVMEFSDKSLKASMRTANKIGADFVAIMGQSELEQKVVILKNMSQESNGSQRTVPIAQLTQVLNGENLC